MLQVSSVGMSSVVLAVADMGSVNVSAQYDERSLYDEVASGAVDIDDVKAEVLCDLWCLEVPEVEDDAVGDARVVQATLTGGGAE